MAKGQKLRAYLTKICTRRNIVLAAVAAGAGVLLRTAYAPYEGQASVAFFAMIPYFIGVRFLEPRRAAGFAFWGGFVFWFSALQWFWPLVDNGGPAILVFMGEVLLGMWCALFAALPAYVLSSLWARWRSLRKGAQEHYKRYTEAKSNSDEEDEALEQVERMRKRMVALECAGPLVAGVAWCGAEWLRGWVGGGFAWYSLGVTQINFTALAQCAAVGGVWLVSAVVATLSDALAGVFVRIYDTIRHTPGSSRRHFDLSIALVVLLIAFCWGMKHFRAVQKQEAGATEFLQVVALNPRLPCIFESDDDEAWNAAWERLGDYCEFAKELKAELIVWPETILSDFMPCPVLEESLKAYSGRLGAAILAGGTELTGVLVTNNVGTADAVVYQQNGLGPVRNGSWLFTAEGIQGPYAKRHLIPFGEYIPLDKSFPILQKLVPSGISCLAGEEPVLMSVTNRAGRSVKLSPLICFEDTVAGVARRSAQGADVLISQSNDAWFTGSCEAQQHHAEARFRAIENGLPFVRASNEGVTSVVSATGKDMEEGNDGFFCHAVPIVGERVVTPYARFGDWLVGIPCAIVLVVLFVVHFRLSCLKRRGCL